MKSESVNNPTDFTCMNEFYGMHIVKTKTLGSPDGFKRYDGAIFLKWRHLSLFTSSRNNHKFRDR